MDDGSLESQVVGLSALDHPLTRQAYELVVDRGELGRDATAEGLGVARSVAAFHLDKLVDAGLLTARYLRLSGRTGPGAGRPAKLYARSAREIDLSLPPRRYDLAGSVLADAIHRAEMSRTPVGTAVRVVARETGAQLGAAATAPSGDGDPDDADSPDADSPDADSPDADSPDADRDRLLRTLDGQGYEPQDRDGEIVLVNCPFHALADRQRALVCGMNLELLSGVVEGLGQSDRVSARLAPEPGYCCVRLSIS